MNFFDQVYFIVKRIPPGKVLTYGGLAKLLGTKDARRVGHALHANKDRSCPCHRVVFFDGSLASGYVFGGPKEQLRKLELEEVKFKNKKVDLSKSLWIK